MVQKIDMDLCGTIFDGVMGKYQKKKEGERKGMDLEKLFQVFNKTEAERVRIRALIKKEREEEAMEAKLERSKRRLHEAYDDIDKQKEKRRPGEVVLLQEHQPKHHRPQIKDSKSKPSTCRSRLIKKMKACHAKNHTNKFRSS